MAVLKEQKAEKIIYVKKKKEKGTCPQVQCAGQCKGFTEDNVLVEIK